MEAYADVLYEMGIGSATIGALSMLLSISVVIAVIGLVLSLVTYILQAIAIHTIANRRGIRGGWLAWIPVAQYWAAGSVSDQYKQTVKNKASHNRVIMLILALVSWVLTMIGGSTFLSGAIRAATAIINDNSYALSQAVALISGVGTLLNLLAGALNIALFVFWQITLYDIYASACPKNAVAFLVLGILFPITIPFFLFCNRKKDEGMRIPQPVEPPVYGDYQNYQY